jgi:hypothetical protein
MQRWSDKAQQMGQPGAPPQKSNTFLKYWMLFLPVILIAANIGRVWQTPDGRIREYQSAARIAGWPLIATGEQPRGVIAIGMFPVGIVALGGLPVGVLAVGGMAAGVFALSGVSLGIFAIGGLAIGWWANGGGAVGYYAFGGLAVGGYAYAGNGVAVGYHLATGTQKERLFG